MTVVEHAFAPAHVTGIFRPASGGRDPRSVGSVGAGVVLDLGAHATASRDARLPDRLDVSDARGRPLTITEEAVRHLGIRGAGRITIRIRADLPSGQGFGMSAAGTLAATLAVASLLGRSRARAIETAHLAELFGQGGLGGVSSILGGGIELRKKPGIPPFGQTLHRRWDLGPFFLIRVGPRIPSPRILGSRRWLQRIEEASEGLSGWGTVPSAHRFLELSEAFTDRLRLGSKEFLRTLVGVRRTGCWAIQAMFGNVLMAVPKAPAGRTRLLRALEQWDLPAAETGAGVRGAGLLGSSASRTAVPRPKAFRRPSVRRGP